MPRELLNLGGGEATAKAPAHCHDKREGVEHISHPPLREHHSMPKNGR